MNIKIGLLTLGLITAMSGCIDSGDSDDTDADSGDGGGGGPATVERISFSGLVADGYLAGAKVCLDINSNKICDDDEPSTTSITGGGFEITDATQVQRDAYPLLVEIVVGSTVDEDTITGDAPTGVAFEKPLTLTAPVGYEFISPLTTMVQNEVEGGATASAAETAVQNKLGTTLDLNSDYVAGKASGENEEEYEQLHQVAQVTARVISDNLVTLEQAASDNNISLDDLISAIVDEVFDALEAITETVEEIADSGAVFDPDAVANTVDEEIIDLEPDTIEDVIAQKEAEEAATSVDMSQLLLTPGLTWFEAEIEDGSLKAEYGAIYNDVNGDFQEDMLVWNGSTFESQAGTPEAGYILKATGWELVSDLDIPDSVVGGVDGSITITKAGGDFIERLISTEVDLAGLNTRTVMNDAEGGYGIWGEYLVADATFPAGSKGYTLADNGSDDAYVFEDWDGCVDTVGGLCSSVYVQNGPLDGQAQSFSEIKTTTAYTFTDVDLDDLNGIKGVEVAYSDSHKLWAEIVDGGVVNYYKVGQDHSAPDVSFLGASTWSAVALSADVAIELVIIPEVMSFDDIAEDGNVILGLIEGYIRMADHEGVDGGSNEPQLRLLNSIAVAVVVGNNFSLDNLNASTPNEPAAATAEFVSGTLAGTYIWGTSVDEKGDSTFIFAANGTGTVHWPPEQDETDPNHAGYDDSLTWVVNAQGLLEVDLTDDAGVNDVGYDRYTITAGTVLSGSVQLEGCDDSGNCEVGPTYTWVKQ